MLRYDVIEAASLDRTPFPHIVSSDVLPPARRADLDRDFPDISITGFVAPDDYPAGDAFKELVADVTSPEFSELLGRKFGIDLASKPTLVTVRKWSEAAAGRPHTDGADKVVTALVYLNDDWDSQAGVCASCPPRTSTRPARARWTPRSAISWRSSAPTTPGTAISRSRASAASCRSRGASARRRSPASASATGNRAFSSGCSPSAPGTDFDRAPMRIPMAIVRIAASAACASSGRPRRGPTRRHRAGSGRLEARRDRRGSRTAWPYRPRSRAQPRPMLQAPLQLRLEAAPVRGVELLARHAVGEIVLAGEGLRRVVVVGVARAVAVLLHQLGRRVEDVLRAASGLPRLLGGAHGGAERLVGGVRFGRGGEVDRRPAPAPARPRAMPRKS